MAVEQASMRSRLTSFHDMLTARLADRSALSQGEVDDTCFLMQSLYDAVHWRKVEIFLLPALRKATSAADQLLIELEGLKLSAANALCTLASLVRRGAIDSEARVREFCSCASGFCQVLLQRLEREEGELFPIARSAISRSAWFTMANLLLLQDVQRRDGTPATAVRGQGKPVLAMMSVLND
jgi:hemerythrin-like domain-containing protein